MIQLPDAVSSRLKRDANGLVCAVIQDATSGRVLMVGYMDDEALARTLKEGRVTFWSRSRQEYWRKGDTSGHFQLLRGIEIDCDGDALLLQVEQIGVACHTGTFSCFDAGGKVEPAFFGIRTQGLAENLAENLAEKTNAAEPEEAGEAS